VDPSLIVFLEIKKIKKMINSHAHKVHGTPHIGPDFGMKHITVPNRAIDKGVWVHSEMDGVPIDKVGYMTIFGSQVVGGPNKKVITTATNKQNPDSLSPTINSGMIYGGVVGDPDIRD